MRIAENLVHLPPLLAKYWMRLNLPDARRVAEYIMLARYLTRVGRMPKRDGGVTTPSDDELESAEGVLYWGAHEDDHALVQEARRYFTQHGRRRRVR
jgi:hypothetical protein